MQQQISHIAVGTLIAGMNPRQYFDEAEMAELEDSIATKGVIQSILVRPVEGGGYMIVAGERRVRAAKKVFGDDYEIPAIIKDISSEEADDLALIENVMRANMSPSEEAAAAAKILGSCEGNRDEAAKRLGWKRAMLDNRLRLMNCSPSVMTALNERRIQLGHAELLAAVTKEKQEKVIAGLLARPSLPSVAEFKAGLEKHALAMDTAIFDKTDCAGCPHNSSNQQALFADAVSSGNCTNSDCFNQKTEAVLESKKTSLAENYPCVVIVRPGDNSTVIKIVAEGATGVGAEQAAACRSCKSYGAAISAVPGKVGNVYEQQCFDTGCHTKKVGEHLLAEKKAAEKPVTTPATGGAKATEKGTEKSAATTAAKPVVTTVQDSQRVVDYRVKVWRKALKAELFADPAKNLCMLLGAMIVSGGSHVSSTKLAGVFKKLTNQEGPGIAGKIGNAATLVEQADDAVRAKMLSGIVLTICDAVDKHQLPEMMAFMNVDLKKHWKLDAEFFDLLTKSEIEVVAEELGLTTALGDAFAKAKNGKKDEFIKALMGIEGFVYEGKIPKVLQAQ